MIKKYLYLLILSCGIFTDVKSQNYADSDQYLVDSLDLDNVSSYEKFLLDSALEIFHKATHDTAKLHALDPFIQNSLDDNVWPKYNLWVHEFTKEKLKQKKLNPKVKLIYQQYLAGSFNDFGFLFSSQGVTVKALENYYKALEIQKEINDEEGMATSYNNIGFIYDGQGNTEKGLEYYKKGYQIQKRIGDEGGMSYTLSNIGMIYYSQKKMDSATYYIHKALDLRLKIDDKSGIGHSYNTIGDLYYDQKNYTNALKYYLKSLEVRESIADKEGISGSLISLGQFYLKDNNISKAKSYAERSFTLAQELGYPASIEQASLLLYDIYLKEQDYKKAHEMYKVYVQMSDSLDSKEAQKILVEQQAKILHEKEMAIEKAEHEKIIAIEKERQQRQKLIIYIGIVGLILLIAFLLFVYNRLKISNRQRKKIEEQRHALSEANEELNQTNEEILAQRDQIDEQRQVLEKQHQNIISSINYAKRIQTALLKNEEHESDHLPPHFILFKPKDIVSGDFYWALEKQGHLYLAAVDCTGHGVPGGFLTMLGTSFLNEINSTPKLHSPATILEELKDKIVSELSQNDGESKDGMDLSLIRLNLTTFEAEWAGANNPIYIVRQGANEVEQIKGDMQGIGIAKKSINYTNHTFKLEKGDSFYLFTDGYPDQFGGPNNRKLGYKRLREILVEINSLNMENQKSYLEEFLADWSKHEKQIDDICMMGFRI